MRLNGWQRLGVIASFIWLPVGFFGTVVLFVNTQTASWEGIYQLCELGAEQSQQNRTQEREFAADEIARTQSALMRAYAAGNTQGIASLQASLSQQQQQQNALATAGDTRVNDDKKCMKEFLKNTSASTRGQWWAGLVGVLMPLFFFWGLAWVCVRLYRWIRAGFASRQA